MENKEVKKLSYEELERALQQISAQFENAKSKNAQLVEMINQYNTNQLMERLNWLWNVINSTTEFLNNDFKTKCAKEFMELMIPETPSEE